MDRVPAAWLLNEAGLASEAKWVLFESADGASHTRYISLDKVMDDVLLVYAANGEMLRPENGYPLRALIPGWEGNVSVKRLRRIKVGSGIGRGSSAARPRAIRTRCLAANGGSSAS